MIFNSRIFKSSQSVFLSGLIIATSTFFAQFLTNSYFTLLDDETAIIRAAATPIFSTLKLFVGGIGQHEHPPLSDLILHFWIPIAGTNPSLLRLPSIFFYVLSLLVLAMISRKLAGVAAYYGTLLFGALWPFGFHFGRLAGWYSFCLLMISLLLLAYLNYLETPNWKNWSFVLLAGYACITSNYYCWIIVFLVGLDLLIVRRLQNLKYLVVGAVVLIVAYAPFWSAFFHEVLHHDHDSGAGTPSPLSKLVNTAFSLYSFFVSESMAPWFWCLSIVTGIAIALVLMLTCRLTSGCSRRIFIGFLVLFAGLAGSGIISTKRLLFISGWMLIPIGCALAARGWRKCRWILAISLATIVVAGWTGIFTRKYYSTPHFIEPWQEIADYATQKIAQRALVVGNSPSFLFYLNGSLQHAGFAPPGPPDWAHGGSVISLLDADMQPIRGAHELFFVRGVNTSEIQRTNDAEQWLRNNCRQIGSRSLVKDNGYEFKKRYFRVDSNALYRITLEDFDCDAQ